MAGRYRHRIVFVVPTCEMNGGIKQCLLGARVLAKHGFHVEVQCPALTDRQMMLGMYIDPVQPRNFDLAVATWYETVATAMQSAPRVVHFCQGYEGWFDHLAAELPAIERAYASVATKICISPHLANFVSTTFRSESMVVAPLVDPLFKPRWLRGAPRPPYRILLTGLFEAELKGIAFALEALRLAAERLPLKAVRISQLPLSAPESALGIPTEYHCNIPPDRVAALTRSCDLALFPSSPIDGFGLPALESIAAGVPVIARRVPGQSALEHLGGVTVPLVDTPGAMAREIEARLRDPDWSDLRRSGLRVARAWRRLADDQFVRAFRRLLDDRLPEHAPRPSTISPL
jgi:glycosyltransferase involved in cell wall biosynthesis